MRKNVDWIIWFCAIAMGLGACAGQPSRGKTARCGALYDRLTKCMMQAGGIPSTIELKPRREFVRACQARYSEARPMVDCVDRSGCDGFIACFHGTRMGQGGAPPAEQ